MKNCVYGYYKVKCYYGGFEVILLFLLIFFLLSWLSITACRDKLSLSFILIYLSWYFLLLIISSFNPFGLRSVSNYSYTLLILYIVSFSLGFVIARTTSGLKALGVVFFRDHSFFSNNWKFVVLLIVLSGIVFFYLLKYNRVLLLEGVTESRSMRFYVGKVFSSQIEVYFYNFVIEPFAIFVAINMAFMYVMRQYNITLLFSIIFLIVYSSFGSGRGYVIELGFLVVFFSLIKGFINKSLPRLVMGRRLVNNSKQSNFYLFVLLSLFYGFAIYLSNVRNGVFEITYDSFVEGNMYFANQIVVYCVGSFRALDHGIEVLAPMVPLMFGRMTFGGVDELIMLGFNTIGFNAHSANGVYGAITMANISIGPDIEYNALYTAVFTHYLDFGVLGLCLFAGLWGYVAGRIIVSFLKAPSLNKIYLIAFLFLVIIGSVLSWRFQSPSAWILVLYFFLRENNVFSFRFRSEV